MQFPVVLDVANYMPYTPQRKEIDLSGHEIVKGNGENYIMTFRDMLPTVGSSLFFIEKS